MKIMNRIRKFVQGNKTLYDYFAKLRVVSITECSIEPTKEKPWKDTMFIAVVEEELFGEKRLMEFYNGYKANFGWENIAAEPAGYKVNTAIAEYINKIASDEYAAELRERVRQAKEGMKE